jgi:hypothetical protein
VGRQKLAPSRALLHEPENHPRLRVVKEGTNMWGRMTVFEKYVIYALRELTKEYQGRMICPAFNAEMVYDKMEEDPVFVRRNLPKPDTVRKILRDWSDDKNSPITFRRMGRVHLYYEVK